jgi:hypothetical protein
MFTVPTAFAPAEQTYRQQRVKAEYSARSRSSGTAQQTRNRRIRLAALFLPHRRPNLTARRPLPAPHH